MSSNDFEQVLAQRNVDNYYRLATDTAFKALFSDRITSDLEKQCRDYVESELEAWHPTKRDAMYNLLVGAKTAISSVAKIGSNVGFNDEPGTDIFQSLEYDKFMLCLETCWYDLLHYARTSDELDPSYNLTYLHPTVLREQVKQLSNKSCQILSAMLYQYRASDVSRKAWQDGEWNQLVYFGYPENVSNYLVQQGFTETNDKILQVVSMSQKPKGYYRPEVKVNSAGIPYRHTAQKYTHTQPLDYLQAMKNVIGVQVIGDAPIACSVFWRTIFICVIATRFNLRR